MLKASQTIRRDDIDWLRVLAVLLLVPFHSSLIFVMDPDSIMYIKDTVNSEFLDRMAGFIHQFHMPLLFTLSGASAYFALGFRSGRQYLKERINRLLIAAIFGVVVLMPPTTYITSMSRGDNMPFLMHLQGFFRLNIDDLAGYYGTLTPDHIWFIIFLFVFSIVGLPIFLSLRSNSKSPLYS